MRRRPKTEPEALAAEYRELRKSTLAGVLLDDGSEEDRRWDALVAQLDTQTLARIDREVDAELAELRD